MIETGNRGGTRASAGDVYDTKPPTDGSLVVRFPRISKALYVYFVRAEKMGLIKIGIAKDVASRLCGLQTGSPDKLFLIGIIRPDDDPAWLEQRLSVMFQKHHSHGEWYFPATELEAYIAKHAISLERNQEELAEQAIARLSAYDARRPAIPACAPKGTSRKAKLARYKLARGIA